MAGATFYGSSIGKKIVVAITGIAFVGFLIAHMLGNLKAFEGAEALNEYAELLRFEPPLLWAFRIGLIVFAILHVWTTVLLTVENRRARPDRYVVYQRQKTNVANRTMIYGGIALGLYVVYHLMHLTWRVVNRDLVPYDHHNVYGNVILSFQNPVITAVYVIAIAALFLHLLHGFQSALRTLGVSHPTYVAWGRGIGIGLALVICLGFVSVPVAVLTGVIK